MISSTQKIGYDFRDEMSFVKAKDKTSFFEESREINYFPESNSTSQFLKNPYFSEYQKWNFPTANILPFERESPIEVASVNEVFQFENRDEVLDFIRVKPDVLNLYKSLHVMIESVFGDAKVRLSVFRDYEEDWNNLRVEIESDHEIEEITALENKLFDLIEKDSSFIAALDHVTISCG